MSYTHQFPQPFSIWEISPLLSQITYLSQISQSSLIHPNSDPSLLRKRHSFLQEHNYHPQPLKKIKVYSHNHPKPEHYSPNLRRENLTLPLKTDVAAIGSEQVFSSQSQNVRGSAYTSDSEISSRYGFKSQNSLYIPELKIEKETVLISPMKPEKIDKTSSLGYNLGHPKQKQRKERYSIVQKPALAEFTEAFPEWGLDAIFDFFESGKNKEEFYRERKAHGRRYKKE